MRLMIIGELEGQLISATQIATNQGAKVFHAVDTKSAMIALRAGRGADIIMLESKFSVKDFKESLLNEKFYIPIVSCGIHDDQKKAVESIAEGAVEYIPLPPDEELIAAMLKSITSEEESINLVSNSPSFKKVIEVARQIAPTNANVLITGKSGAGKEVIAKFIHTNSKRKKDLISLNCAAIPDNLLESELFGHEKGAFTGAIEKRVGKFEEANGGTILLDEISEMELRLQAKLLRAIQEREITRVGGNKVVKLDIRVLATSNRNLINEVKAGRFREDLFYRLNVIHLKLPSLNERIEDIEPLSKYFIDKYCKINDIKVKEIDKAATQKLINYTWNGNVRELENTIHLAVLLSVEDVITKEDIQFLEEDFIEGSDELASLKDTEKDAISKAFLKFGDNYDKAARVLGVSIKTLRKKLDEYKITSE